MEIFVTKLSRETTETDLLRLFEPYRVIGARLVTDRDTGQSRGFAFVAFWDPSEATRAILDLDGLEFMGRQIVVRQFDDRRGAM